MLEYNQCYSDVKDYEKYITRGLHHTTIRPAHHMARSKSSKPPQNQTQKSSSLRSHSHEQHPRQRAMPSAK